MVFGLNPVCSKCKITSSAIWQKNSNKDTLCNECFTSFLSASTSEETNMEMMNESEHECLLMEVESFDKKVETYSGRIITTKEDDDNDIDREKESGKNSDKKESKKKTRKGRQGGKGNIPKGKGRRFIFKKSATKAPVAVSTSITSEFIFYQGMYYQVGDIVSVIDEGGGTYYAQIRGLLQDQYCEKSAVITWLLPTKSSPPPEVKFDPSTYIIGPEEEVPRKLEYLSFVCHAPSDYYKDKTSPYATVCYSPQSCYVWSKMAPVIKSIDGAKELMAK